MIAESNMQSLNQIWSQLKATTTGKVQFFGYRFTTPVRFEGRLFQIALIQLRAAWVAKWHCPTSIETLSYQP